jgi:hypothetical protein
VLFNSFAFLLGFLPAALLAFHTLRRLGLHRASLVSLVVFSFGFYAWWNQPTCRRRLRPRSMPSSTVCAA